MNASEVNSVCLAIPAFNAAGQIETLLDQSRRQIRTFDEVIVFDDGSTDDTAQRARAGGALVIGGEVNRGSGFARNAILEKTRSNYIHFHDADDPLPSPEFLAKLLPLASSQSAAFCSWKSVEEDGSLKLFSDCYVGVADWSEFLVGFHIHLNALLFPVGALRSIGGFDPEMRQQQDLLLLARLAAAGLQFHHTTEVLAEHRKHPQSTLGSSTKAQKLEWSRRLYLKMLDDPKIPRAAIDQRANWTIREIFNDGTKESLRLACGDMKSGRVKFQGRGRLSAFLGALHPMFALSYERARQFSGHHRGKKPLESI